MKKLSPPTMVVFLISLIIVIIGCLAALGTITGLPVASVWIVTGGYALLAIGCLFKGA